MTKKHKGVPVNPSETPEGAKGTGQRQWTSGEWKCEAAILLGPRAFDVFVDTANGKAIIVTTDVGKIVPGSESWADGSDKSNALLCASAPNLYAALVRVVEWMDANGYKSDDASFGARAAIAKAEGR